MRSKVSGKVILDVGFAADFDFEPTLFKLIAADNLDSQVVGADINAAKLSKLRLSSTVVADIFYLPFTDSSIDCVIAGEIFEHLPSIWGAIEEMSRVVRKGGKVIVTTPSPFAIFRFLKHWFFPRELTLKNTNAYLANYDHKIFWDPLSLIKLFNLAKFEPVEVTTTNLALPYIPNLWRNPQWNFWPLNRFGTYSCMLFRKL